MPKRNDIEKVLLIGSGPYIIGQNSEYDYCAVKALKALRELDVETVYVNSNPLAISTNKELADSTYIEPLDVRHLAAIIARENPSAILPVFGGQKALNLVSELSRAGILEKYDVKIIGLSSDDILKTENRELFKRLISNLGLRTAESSSTSSVEEAESIGRHLGFPLVIRPAFTIGGFGGGLVYNIEELRDIAGRGINASLAHNILIERAVIGWKELEVEALRDANGATLMVGIVENIDPMGVHTGDSMTVVPPQTLSKDIIDRIKGAVVIISDTLSVQGSLNVQFAYDPVSDSLIVIEVNLRATRTTALVSRVYGLDIADISTRLSMGILLSEIETHSTTLDKYRPKCDYIAIKMPRWSIDKFKGAKDYIHTQMKSYGEAVAFGCSFEESFVKVLDMTENGSILKDYKDIETCLANPSSERYYQIINALLKGITKEKIVNLTGIDKYYIHKISKIVDVIIKLNNIKSLTSNIELLKQAKAYGLSDDVISYITRATKEEIFSLRENEGVLPIVANIGNFGAYFLTYQGAKMVLEQQDKSKKILIVGNGPNRIGQGGEFDYLVREAAQSIAEHGYEPIIINSNPAGVSTDMDYKVYYEPITAESICGVYENEKVEGVLLGFGGHTPYSLTKTLERQGIKILDTKYEKIELTQDITKYALVLDEIGIASPKSGIADNVNRACEIASDIGYPLIVRLSYMIGGKGNAIIHQKSELQDYMANLANGTKVTIEEFLTEAKEYEVDIVCNGDMVYVPQVMEHIEYAGIHSGDSDSIIPPVNNADIIKNASEKIAKTLNIKGLINIKYAMVGDKLYLLETRLRASRTVALMSRVTGINIVDLAIAAILGNNNKMIKSISHNRLNYYAVKAAIFPFEVFRETDPKLGPEMKSTGCALGVATTLGEAFYKAQTAAYAELPLNGRVLVSIDDSKKKYLEPIAREFINLGYTIVATGGTYGYLLSKGIKSEKISKMDEGRPNVADAMINGDINLLVNTPSGIKSEYDDSYIRKVAIRQNICYITTIEAAQAAINGIKEAKSKCSVIPLQKL